FFQAEDGIRDWSVTGVQTCALPICATVTIDVDRLALVEAEALARSLLGGVPGAETLARAAAREADGSPFFVAELVRELADGSPRSEERRVGEGGGARGGGVACGHSS